MPLINENTASRLSERSRYQQGINNLDNDKNLEKDKGIPWSNDPAGSYLYYDCSIIVMLDNGTVIHNKLPQVNNTPDTLSSVFLDDKNIDTVFDRGVNLQSHDQYTDILQRMGHSRYYFNLRGRAMRVGYKIPIPAIKNIGGVPAVLYDRNPQIACNSIVPGGNYGGVILWRAWWSLWYTTLTPPKYNTIPAADPFAHISDNQSLSGGIGNLPKNIQVPFSEADFNSEPTRPGINPQDLGGIAGGKR